LNDGEIICYLVWTPGKIAAANATIRLPTNGLAHCVKGFTMAESSVNEVTALLLAWNEGDPAALKKLTPLVYQELRRLAKGYMGRERPGHLLQTTALMKEGRPSRSLVINEWLETCDNLFTTATFQAAIPV
jgi:hypothetical protein